MPPVWKSIISYWANLNLPIRPGVTTEKIAKFEKNYGVSLPADLSEYFHIVDGTGINESDECLTSFLSLTEMQPVHVWWDDSAGVIYTDRNAYPDCFVFADLFFSSWLYAVQITSDPTNLGPVYRVIASDIPSQIEARSFREFMSRYANDPCSIL